MPKRSIRFFNTTGPCDPDDHYMLPPAERLIGAQLHRYIKDKLYWVLHAPRQTGKTTFLKSWMRKINASGDALACYVSVERAQGLLEIERAMPEICTAIQGWAQKSGLPAPEIPASAPGSSLNIILTNWAALIAPKPLVVLFDETDVLQGEALISFLRQLRDGFAGRGIGAFPVSIALVGMRDLKDYITAAKGGVPVNPGSPFNIKADSAVIGNFSRDDIARLFAQRTAETGQQIAPEALDYTWEQSRGQPWLVNSLLKRATLRILDETSTETVTAAHIHEAREQMILARETHLEALAYRLQDPGIRHIMETLITGETDLDMAGSDAFRQCIDLGLVSAGNGPPAIANPIYREVLAREIAWGAQAMLPVRETFRWQKPDGALDMDALLREFQGFWQENSETWEETSNYTEAFPHLLLMAFLQRITNGEGRIEREYAAGRKSMDLAVEYLGEWNIIEIKLLRNRQTFEKVKAEGIGQVLAYRDRFSSALRAKKDRPVPCYLLIFDRRPDALKLPWDRRIQWFRENDVTVLGC
ncbi:MAG: hypothetical protein LBC18_15890 [Opitutaceae bacterium]|jgi:hypothetical protein|nr:hypothetical protein [Opitutaceae bacterium]